MEQKVNYSVAHAQERALERYGLEFTAEDIFAIVNQIHSGTNENTVFLRR